MTREEINPLKCRIRFKTLNSAQVPLKNHSMLRGAIYNIIHQIDPVFAYAINKSTVVRPWSFSLLNFHNKVQKTEKQGFYSIEKGFKGFFTLKTIDSRIVNFLKEYIARGLVLHVGQLKIQLQDVDIEQGNFNNIPENIDTMTIRLETPTFFYNNKTKKQEKLSSEILLNYQCEKFKQLGIINMEPEQLYPYLWILEEYTREQLGYLTSKIDKTKSIAFRGIVGNITFKIYGSSFERSLIWKLLYLSEFTGIGTRTSSGFGHNTLVSVKKRELYKKANEQEEILL